MSGSPFAFGKAAKRTVELAVPAAVKPVAVGPTGEAGIGPVPLVRASLASVAKRSAPAISPTSFAGQRAAAALGEQLRSVGRGQPREL